MKNTSSIIISLVGGAILGSAVTCLLHKKGCKMSLGKGDIHKKIMDELEQLRQFIAAHHPEGTCCSEDSACKINAQE
ncbi:MAG: hypothetical protein SNF93_00075 [Rikenellaceae bacterium]